MALQVKKISADQWCMILTFIDAIGKYIQKHASVKNQVRLGVVMSLIALPLFVWGFFVDEPFLVYQMSALALFFTGLSTVVAAVPSEKK